jgi:hypothetical protein
MFRKLSLIFCLVGGVALMAACGDDDTKTDTGPSGDDSSVQLDGGTQQDQGGTQQDQGSTQQDQGSTQQDQGSTTGGSLGAKCNQNNPCSSGLMCAALSQGASFGFCTKKCTGQGQPCTGGPSGTAPYCALSDGKGNLYCVFICKISQSGQSKTWPCPKDLTCGKPDKNGTAICKP